MQRANRWVTVVLAVVAISTGVAAQRRSALSASRLLKEELSPIPARAEAHRAEGPAVAFTFAVMDFPAVGAHQNAHQINDHSRVVGTYTALSSNTEGYLLQGSNFKKIVYPAAGVNATSAWGINKAGVVVGSYSSDGGSTGHGFMLKGKTYTTLDYPGATLTAPYAINASGVIVGAYSTTSQYVPHGFMLSGGAYTPIDFPSATDTTAYAINASGMIVGTYQLADGSVHGFTFQGGSYTSVDYPAAIETILNGINDSGQIVGTYVDAADLGHGFLLRDGVLTSFDVPFAGVTLTSPGGINNKNQISGRYVDNAGFRWGFVATFQ